MSALQRIAYYRHRRDAGPNQELARDLAAKKDRKGIQQIAENLWNENSQIQSECLKVLYEIGFPYLLHHLETCRPKDVPQHAEKIAVAVNARNQQQFVAVLEERLADLSDSQIARVKKVIQEVKQR